MELVEFSGVCYTIDRAVHVAARSVHHRSVHAEAVTVQHVMVRFEGWMAVQHEMGT